MKKTSGTSREVEQSAPLGTEPYVQLLERTASDETDTYAAKIGLLLLWHSDLVLDALDEDLSPYGITESKLDLLLLLDLHRASKGLTPSAIAERLGIKRASVTGLLDWVEKRGWIARIHDQTDRRMLRVDITEAGRELVAQVLPAFWSSCAALVDDVSREEQHLLEGLLAKMQRRMKARFGNGR